MTRYKSEVILNTIFYYLEQQIDLRKEQEELVKLLGRRVKQEEEISALKDETINLLNQTIKSKEEYIKLLKVDNDSKLIKFLKKFL